MLLRGPAGGVTRQASFRTRRLRSVTVTAPQRAARLRTRAAENEWGGAPDGALGQYVNDRPYAASSRPAVALRTVFATAMSGRCDAGPELPGRKPPLRVEVPALPARGGPSPVRRLLEPPGWSVEPTRSRWICNSRSGATRAACGSPSAAGCGRPMCCATCTCCCRSWTRPSTTGSLRTRWTSCRRPARAGCRTTPSRNGPSSRRPAAESAACVGRRPCAGLRRRRCGWCRRARRRRGADTPGLSGPGAGKEPVGRHAGPSAGAAGMPGRVPAPAAPAHVPDRVWHRTPRPSNPRPRAPAGNHPNRPCPMPRPCPAG